MGITDYTLAIITMDKNFQNCGACPVFYVDDNESLQQKALLMSKCVGGMVHELTEQTLIIVKH
jgi:hypothetical protein